MMGAWWKHTAASVSRTCRLLQGISNEVEPYFGVNKFQLGRLLRARLQQRLRLRQGRVHAELDTLVAALHCYLHLASAAAATFF